MTADAPETGRDAPAIDPLHRIGVALTELDPDRLIQRLTDEATAMCRAQFGAFFYNVINQRGECYMLYTLSGVPREAFAGFPMPRATEIFRPTFDGTEVLRLDDVLTDPRFGHNAPYKGMPPGHLPVRSYLAVPVFSRTGEVLGGLFFGHAEPGRFTADDERMMVAVANQTGLALDNARLYAAVEAREQQYRFLADAMPQIVYTSRPNGQLDYVNARWTLYTGLTLAQTQGDGWDLVIHPEDIGGMQASWRSALASGEIFERLYRIRRITDGAYRWHLGRSVPRRNDDGTIVQWVGTSTDVDDQQRSSDALRFLAAASAELSASLDHRNTLANVAKLAIPQVADFCIIAISGTDGALQRLAAAHVEPARLASLQALGDQDLREPDAPGSACQVMRSGRASLIDEIGEAGAASDDPRGSLLHAVGARSWLCVPVLARGRAIGAITFGAAGSGRRFAAADLRVAEDLAVRVSVAVENARLYHDAQEANRAKDQFLATVSHELRTPLTAILGWTRMLRSPQLDDDRRRRGLETIERSARAQTQLIEDLLDISRIISGKMRLEPRSIDPSDPIEA
ncbi:MAG TPA: GAF domain-containing protein, partial [Nannocystis sp.]